MRLRVSRLRRLGGYSRPRQHGAAQLLTPERRSLAGSLTAGLGSQLALVVGGILAARSLGPNDRGYFALLLLVPHILAQVGTLGFPLSITYFTARRPLAARRIARASLRPAILQVTVCIGLQVLILFFLLRGDPSRVRVAAIVSLGVIPGLLAIQYGLAILQGQQRFTPFNVLRVMPSALYSFGVLGIYILGYRTLVAITIVQVLALGAVGAVVVWVALKGLPRKATDSAVLPTGSDPAGAEGLDEAPPAKEFAWFGIRGLLGSMSAVETFRIDQAVIGLFLSPVALGLYVVGVSITNLPRFLTQSVGMVAYPKVAAADDSSTEYRLVWQYFWIATAVAVAVVVPLEAGAQLLIPFFFGSDFERSVPIAQILLAGTVAVGARRVLADGLRGAGHPGLGTVAEVAAWLALAPLLAFFVPRLEVEGVAIALTVSWALSLLLLIAATLVVSSGRTIVGSRPGQTRQLEKGA